MVKPDVLWPSWFWKGRTGRLPDISSDAGVRQWTVVHVHSGGFAKANRKQWAVLCDWSPQFDLWEWQRTQEGDVQAGRYADYQGKWLRVWQHVNNKRERLLTETCETFFLICKQYSRCHIINYKMPTLNWRVDLYYAAVFKVTFRLLREGVVFLKHLSWVVEHTLEKPVVQQVVFYSCLLTRAIQWCCKELWI